MIETPICEIIDDFIDPQEFYARFTENAKKVEKEEMKACCPLHADRTPSFQFNLVTGKFQCFGCGKKGHYAEFLQYLNNWTQDEALDWLRQQYDKPEYAPKWGESKKKPKQTAPKPTMPFIPPETVAGYQERLFNSPKLMEYLTQTRGLDELTIIKYMVGSDGDRFTIPVYDSEENCINVRRYSPKKEPKILSYGKGYGSLAIYPDIPDGDVVIICEGEWDTLLARQHKLPAVTRTGGATSWDDSFSPLFAGKIVIIAQDNDQPGREGSITIAESLAPYAASVRILRWPPDFPEKGDMTDLLLQYPDLKVENLINEAQEYVSIVTSKIPKDFKGIIPNKGFLRSWLTHCASMTDAPPNYHLACGLSILAAAVGRNVKFYGYGGKLYKLNLWTILLGPSGDRKSVSIDAALRVLTAAVHPVLLPNQYSQESMLKAMSTQHRWLLHCDEFSHLLASAKRDYMSGFIQTLTSLFEKDGDHIYETMSMRGEPIVVRDPALSILAASTLDWLVKEVDENVIRGGFFPRCLCWPSCGISGQEVRRGQPNSVIEDSLVDFVRDASQLAGIATFCEEADTRYDAWFKTHDKLMKEGGLSERLKAFLRRAPIYLLKFAVIYQISFDKTIEVSVEAMEQAIRTIEYLKVLIRKLADEEFIGNDKSYKDVKNVYNIIKDRGEISYEELLAESFLKVRVFDDCLQTLLQSGRIEIQGAGTEKLFRIKESVI